MDKGKSQVAYGEIVAKCWEDAAYKKEFIQDPEAKLTEAGIAVEEGVSYKVIEAPKLVQYIVLPYENSKSAVQEFVKLLLSQSEKTETLILPDFEVRMIQDTADTRHLILPASPKTLAAAELAAVTGGAGQNPGLVGGRDNNYAVTQDVSSTVVQGTVQGGIVVGGAVVII